jgi:hypothetical protein
MNLRTGIFASSISAFLFGVALSVGAADLNFAECVPKVETAIVPDAPHAVHIVSPAKFNALVLLDRNVGPPYNKVRNDS